MSSSSGNDKLLAYLSEKLGLLGEWKNDSLARRLTGVCGTATTRDRGGCCGSSRPSGAWPSPVDL